MLRVLGSYNGRSRCNDICAHQNRIEVNAQTYLFFSNLARFSSTIKNALFKLLIWEILFNKLGWSHYKLTFISQGYKMTKIAGN